VKVPRAVPVAVVLALGPAAEGLPPSGPGLYPPPATLPGAAAEEDDGEEDGEERDGLKLSTFWPPCSTEEAWAGAGASFFSSGF